jgi:hypothetical protein
MKLIALVATNIFTSITSDFTACYFFFKTRLVFKVILVISIMTKLTVLCKGAQFIDFNTGCQTGSGIYLNIFYVAVHANKKNSCFQTSINQPAAKHL